MRSQKAVRMNRPIMFRVLDGEENTKEPLDAVVSVGPSGLTIAIKGHGLQEMDDDCNEIIHLDYFQGKLSLLVWSDINSPEPTHTIPLEGAKLTNRKPTPGAMAETVSVDRREKQSYRGKRSNRPKPDASSSDNPAPRRGVIRRRPRTDR